MASIRTHGPFFDARRTRFTNNFCHAVAEETTEMAERLWVKGMKSTFKHPTPIYWNTTHVVVNGNVGVLNDGGRAAGLVYGPWLEGKGSRNKTTRFKGYFNLRKALEQTRARFKVSVVAPLLRSYYLRMNGA